MFIRKKKNPSGVVSVQVIDKRGGNYRVVKTVGSRSNATEIEKLYQQGKTWLADYHGQRDMVAEHTREQEEKQITAHLPGNIENILLNGTQLILNRVFHLIGFDRIDDEILKHLVVSRICQPRSKVATVDRDGYPLSYSLFNGSQYEGRTMLPIVEDFVKRFDLDDFVVVADAGLMNKTNRALLESGGYKYIIGARIKNESEEIKQWILSLEKQDGCFYELGKIPHCRLIVGYSDKRAKKDAFNREKGRIKRLCNQHQSFCR
ncbi:hypothetical protein AGMMS49525_02840 [Bacteroidia bacterium]|nr:hypothetical protein AGMMS49525_02840 [Bacteroidia bacterium]